MAQNPFVDDPTDGGRLDPFGEEVSDDPLADGANRMEHAARKIRMLKSRLGGEGLTPSATRELLAELGTALDAAAGALRSLEAGK
ncbi:MAG: hypothetical protein WEB88_14640 [Gemmatimonadota bacterium]